MKQVNLKKVVIFFVLIGSVMGLAIPVSADDSDSINEKLGVPIMVYGDTLSAEQKQKVRETLDVTDSDHLDEYDVTGQDIAKYIDGNPNSNMYSSAKITPEEKGKGLSIDIVTPDNITEVTKEMYANALLTAGVEDATVKVASPVKVSGHSALTGIYKAYDEKGAHLDKERMKLADEELGVATDLADKDGMDKEKASKLLTDIKQEIADKKPATKEDVRKIVEDQLDKLDVNLSDQDRERLDRLFEKMHDLNIDFGKVKSQLKDIATTVKDKMDDLGLDEGFWKKVGHAIKDFFEAIVSFFKGLFN